MSLFSALSVSASGMAAQRTRAALLVENIANSETTRTPEGGPYRRKDVVFSSEQVGASLRVRVGLLQLGEPLAGVKVAGISVDTRPGKTLHARPSRCGRRWLRCHARVNPAEDMVDLMGANRELPGERRGHVGGQGHDSEIDRSVAIRETLMTDSDLKHHSNLHARDDRRR